MINFARQGFANPFFPGVGAPVPPGLFGSIGVPAGIPMLPGNLWGSPVPFPHTVAPTAALGFTNPFVTQLAAGLTPMVNPWATTFGANWPAGLHPALAARVGIDPRQAFGAGSQQVGIVDPNLLLTSDPTSYLVSQQVAPFGQQLPIGGFGPPQLSPVAQQQQLPIRPLTAGQQQYGMQPLINQWADSYRALLEAQLISQLATNPLHHLTRGYAGIPEATGLGSINPFLYGVPFCG